MGGEHLFVALSSTWSSSDDNGGTSFWIVEKTLPHMAQFLIFPDGHRMVMLWSTLLPLPSGKPGLHLPSRSYISGLPCLLGLFLSSTTGALAYQHPQRSIWVSKFTESPPDKSFYDLDLQQTGLWSKFQAIILNSVLPIMGWIILPQSARLWFLTLY